MEIRSYFFEIKKPYENDGWLSVCEKVKQKQKNTKLTCGRIQTTGFRRDNDFVEFGGKSVSSCKPHEPRDKIPLHVRPLFGSVPFEMASIDRGRDNVDR